MRTFLHTLTIVLLSAFSLGVRAQVTGTVLDSKTKKPLDYVFVFYDGKQVGVQTDENGQFAIKEDSTWNELTFSTMGYEQQVVRLYNGKKKNLRVLLKPNARNIEGVKVQAKRTHYSRKNNPAVEMMRKVIAAKKKYALNDHDYYFYSKYEKMTFSVNEFTERVFEEGEFKKLAFLKDHVETCPETGKLILPLTVDETVSQTFYRKSPHSEKRIILGESSKGVNELINTGEIVTTVLKDVFTEVDIYDEECRLLQYPFKSPIANSAISFYRYYIQDTTYIEGDKVFDIGFLPNNMQDFGFSGHLYVMADSSWQVRRVELDIPSRSDVNFVENMLISQDFELLASGERVVVNNDMLVQLKLAKWVSKFQVQQTSRYSDFSFEPIAPKVFKKIKGTTYKEPDAAMRGDGFWKDYRKVELTQSEGKMDTFIKKIESIKGFKYFIFGLKALVENFVETSDSLETNKVDIGPINTMISQNHFDGVRFRLSALTTAHLHPHVFANGYMAYATHSGNLYGRGQLTCSFNKKAYLTREFPQNNLSISYLDDIISPFDQFINTDKDNVFTSFHASKVDQYMHVREWLMTYDKEWINGLKLSSSISSKLQRPVDRLFYQSLGTGLHEGAPTNDPHYWTRGIRTTEVKVGLSYEPGATYINTKQRRLKVSLDAPVFAASHTFGLNHFLGGQYEYNITEASIYKRFWVGSWGKIDTYIKGGMQWNVVPFPLLIHPAANQSFIIEDFTFNLISNYEFLNDRYVSGMFSWDLNGKLFNRVPLLKRLKWREYIGVNVLWGTLSDKNNPANSGYKDPKLFYFPGHFNPDGTYKCNTMVMDKNKPYVEMIVGIHNIFKLIHVEYVRRLSYIADPDTNRDGIRFMVRVTF